MVYHFDFYRLNEGGMVELEMSEALADPKAIVVVEWGDVVQGTLPAERIDVRFDRTSEGEDRRKIAINYHVKFDYLVEGVKL